MRSLALLLAAVTLAAAAPPPISADRIKADVATLASDAFGGRGPGEPGDAKTVAFLQESMAKAGLKPGGPGGSWLQPVPLVRLDRMPGAAMAMRFGGQMQPLLLGRDATLALRNPGATMLVRLPLVFAGFGIADKGYDPYRVVDVAGKVAVVLANDPDFEAGKDLGFEGRRLAFAGRSGAKFEAAARAGAAGVLLIHEDAAASYPWLQVGSGDKLPAMAAAPLKPSPLQFSGWLAGPVAAELLAAGGHDLPTLKARAREPGFTAIALPATVDVGGTLQATPFTSHNVIGLLPGAARPAEVVLYGAHWDANGVNGPDSSGDAIRNGAVDNATGTAELLEVARAFAAGLRPARSVVFAAWTAEEKGLPGAEYYAANPVFPLSSTVAVINLDPHVVLPAATNIELVGSGRTPLENDLKAAASQLGLRTDDEPNPEAGWYFRSDHYPFARRGVPALSFRAGRDLVEGGLAKGDALVGDYNARRYHQPSDAFMPDWTFAGTAQEASVAFLVGQKLAHGTDWPIWNPGSEYAPLRAPTVAAESFFARLVAASASPDQRELIALLSTKTLSTNNSSVVEGNRSQGGPLRHGIPAPEIAKKLKGCVIDRWVDVDNAFQYEPFILWNCPDRRASNNNCFFDSYRASFLDARYHPPNFFVAHWPAWDIRCGPRLSAPAPQR